MSNGFHRVHLRADDGDHLTFYVPLKADGRLDVDAHKPWLLKALWDGYEYVGELVLGSDKLHRIVWTGLDIADQLTDFGTVPIRRGSIVRVYEAEEDSAAYEFAVVDVRRV